MTDSYHSFHIPVMGTAFTIESPLKVARYGISSVISCVDDTLIEKMRRFYCKMIGEEPIPIARSEPDSRAKRITAYLDLMDRIVRTQVEKLKTSAFEIGSEINKYFELLADASPLYQAYRAMLTITNPEEKAKAQDALRGHIRAGAIDVNIMTKLDRTNYAPNGEPLAGEYSDAMAALRGYAESDVSSGMVFSAGFNGHLYGYVEQFEDFHADADGHIKKKIILKVNDYRSAFTQGKFFAKKGLWVSEYRIESGLNCGGHAFGHGGNLMGPSLEEFKVRREELIASLFEIYNKARRQKGKKPFDRPHAVRFTAQGGIGTAGEHNFLLKYYALDATGWGTPFLLVPEATTVDDATLKHLCEAKQDDLYLSDISPLGVPFNNLRTSLSEEVKKARTAKGTPGSPCNRGHLVSNTEFTEKPICLASRLYQKLKIDRINATETDEEKRKEEIAAVTAKACLCNDLGGTAVLVHDLHEEGDLPSAPAICPGPNLAYFSRTYTLKEMIDHIYGRVDLLKGVSRPNMFINELRMYVNYLEMEIRQALSSLNDQRIKYFREFLDNLHQGVSYYETLFTNMAEESEAYKNRALADLRECAGHIRELIARYPEILERS